MDMLYQMMQCYQCLGAVSPLLFGRSPLFSQRTSAHGLTNLNNTLLEAKDKICYLDMDIIPTKFVIL